MAQAGQRAVVVWTLLMALASVSLLVGLLTRDFSIRFVATASESTQSIFYTITAFWGGHDGALLLWALVLGIYMTLGVRSLRDHPDLQGPATATLLAVAIFFSVLLATASNPFHPLLPPPPDGQGLNPLLRNPWMVAHPPALYLGYVGMSVPFAIAVGALISGRLDESWIELSRRWVLVAWAFLTLGILLGAKWAYVVLGWGGYWAWDPVENAALMPWLTATAFIHSIQIQARRRMLAAWNASLILLTFGLTIFGTFLVRSGILSSVHAFAQAPTIGYMFLGLMALLLIGSFGLLVWRWESLRSHGGVESVVSRETAFLANNLLFVAAAVVVFLGTIFPALTEVFRGVKVNVGPPYYNMVMVPVGIGILALMGLGPMMPWRRATAEQLAHNFLMPAALAVLGALLLGVLGVRKAGPLMVFALSLFVVGTVALEAARGVSVRVGRGEGMALAAVRLVLRNRRRYGGYLVHLGVLLVFAGVAASSVFSTQSQAVLRPGQRFEVGRYILEYGGLRGSAIPGVEITEAAVRVWTGSRWLGILSPQRYFYASQEQSMHRVAIRSSPREDLYVILSDWTEDGAATIRVLVNPLVSWMWAGGVVIVLGTLLAALPERRLRPARTTRPLRRSAGGGLGEEGRSP